PWPTAWIRMPWATESGEAHIGVAIDQRNIATNAQAQHTSVRRHSWARVDTGGFPNDDMVTDHVTRARGCSTPDRRAGRPAPSRTGARASPRPAAPRCAGWS